MTWRDRWKLSWTGVCLHDPRGTRSWGLFPTSRLDRVEGPNEECGWQEISSILRRAWIACVELTMLVAGGDSLTGRVKMFLWVYDDISCIGLGLNSTVRSQFEVAAKVRDVYHTHIKSWRVSMCLCRYEKSHLGMCLQELTAGNGKSGGRTSAKMQKPLVSASLTDATCPGESHCSSIQQRLQILPSVNLLDHLPEIIITVIVSLRFEVRHVILQPRRFGSSL